MSYPEQSDWNSSQLNSAWYVTLVRGVQRVCSTEGLNFLIDLQIALRDRLNIPSFPVADFDTSGVSGPGWTTSVLAALLTLATRDGAPREYLDSIRADFARGAGPVSPATMQVALWVTYWNASWTASGNQVFGYGSPSDIQIPVGASLPTIGVRPPVPTNGVRSFGVNCIVDSSRIPTVPPLRGSVSLLWNPWMAFAVLAAAVVGAAVLMRKTPRVVEIRKGRRLP